MSTHEPSFRPERRRFPLPRPAATTVLPLLVLSCCLSVATAQAPDSTTRRGVPQRNALTGMSSMGGGAQMTPDGRLVLRGWAYNGNMPLAGINGWPQNTINGQPGGTVAPVQPGWAVQVVRPELITRDPAYQPVFTAGCFSPAGGYLIEPGADLGQTDAPGVPYPQWVDHPNATYGNSFIFGGALPPGRAALPGAVASGIPHKAHTTWFPDPVLDLSPNNELPSTNPYVCDASGVPTNGLPAPAAGVSFVAYEMIAVTFCEDFVQQAHPTLPGVTYWHDNPNGSRARQVPMKIVVQNPYTTSATIKDAWVTGVAQDLGWGTANNAMYLAELSITQNGHFLVGHGRRPSSYVNGINSFPSSFEFGHVIWASWNPNPGNPLGWHEPVLLSEVHQYGATTLKVVNGVNIPLRDVVRLAREPMRYQNGDPIGEVVVDAFGNYVTNWDASLGAYPWVHWDGDGVMYPIGGSRGTIAYCGLRTNNTFMSLDAANLSQLFEIAGEEHDITREEHVMSGLMAMTGMWDVYRDTPANTGRSILEAHPAHPVDPVMAFIHGEANPMRLTTVSLEDWSDGEYVAFLRMTPLVKRIDRISSTYPLDKLWTRHELDIATDTSGSYREARLLPNANAMHAVVPNTHAAFTVETSDARPHSNPPGQLLPHYRPKFDSPAGVVHDGRIGEAVRFGRLGYIEVAPSQYSPPDDDSLSSGEITVEAFVRVTRDFLALSRTTDTQLFRETRRFSIGITPTGALRVEAWSLGAVATYTTTPVLTTDSWYHLGFTYRAGKLTFYVNGASRGLATLGSAGLDPVAVSQFEIGPQGTVSGSDQVLMYVDEFRLSRIARSPIEMARHAFTETDRTWVTNPAQLPPLAGTPVTVADCRVDPARPWSAAKSAFGAYAFNSKLLSLNQNFACASCHDPSANFQDNRALAKGHSGILLPFSTPTILNSITGAEMFWDMRAASLFAQAPIPIVTPEELGFTSLTTPLANLNADPTATALHQVAFGFPTVNGKTLAAGLESYMQAQIAASTAVESYESGTANALTAQEKHGRALFRGKARCIACHHGPSYTDSIAHNTGAADLGQLGLVQQTGRVRDTGAFKTPTLRAIGGGADTAPYFHDGFGRSLSDVVKFYNEGGGSSGRNPIDPNRQVLGDVHVEVMRLGLTTAEMVDLVAFLKAVGS